MQRSLVIIALMLCACGVESRSVASGRHVSSWSSGSSDSAGVPDAVVCTDVVSHPCPWLLYTHELLVGDAGVVTWTDADGGVDGAGVEASARPDVVEQAIINDDETLSMPSRGDDGGLRRAFTLSPTSCGGWEANVTWTLFNIAGNTTFKLSVTP